MKEKEEFSSHFRAIQLKFSRFYTRVLLETGLTLPQYALLNQLAAAGDASMTEISSRLHITKPAVTHLVDRLEAAKFLKRAPHPKDRRVYILEILPKGERVIRSIQSRILKFLLKTLSQFDAAERKIIIRFYALLSETIEGVLSHPEDMRK